MVDGAASWEAAPSSAVGMALVVYWVVEAAKVVLSKLVVDGVASQEVASSSAGTAPVVYWEVEVAGVVPAKLVVDGATKSAGKSGVENRRSVAGMYCQRAGTLVVVV